MKRLLCFTGIFLTILLAFPVNMAAQESESFMGNWEGMFMNDFRTLIQLESDTAQSFSGRILLYDGEIQIQDDELFKIGIQENKLTFYIMAKETHYKGELDTVSGELNGIFIFPDDSEHPLTVKKVNKSSLAEPPPE